MADHQQDWFYLFVADMKQRVTVEITLTAGFKNFIAEMHFAWSRVVSVCTKFAGLSRSSVGLLGDFNETCLRKSVFWTSFVWRKTTCRPLEVLGFSPKWATVAAQWPRSMRWECAGTRGVYLRWGGRHHLSETLYCQWISWCLQKTIFDRCNKCEIWNSCTSL